MLTPAQTAWNRIAALVILREGRPKHFQSIDNLRIQKLCFRSEIKGKQSGHVPAFFKFFRYDLGPYSKELANEVTALEARDFVNSETRCLTWRGEYLLEYVAPEIEKFKEAQRAIQVIEEVCEECRSIRASSTLVDKTYEMVVPVDQFGDRMMKVKDIPMHTDIIIPELMPNAAYLSDEMIADLEEEWKIPPSALDESSAEFNEVVDSAYRRVLAM